MESVFPKERIPDNFLQRTKRASLRFFEHRAEVTEVYLRLVASLQQDIDEIREVAEAIDWKGEYDLVLDYQTTRGVDPGPW